MKRLLTLLGLSLIGATVPAGAETGREGIHVFVVSSKTGQIVVDQDVIGPFSGTAAEAAREESRLKFALEKKGLTISSRSAVYKSGQCIGVFKNPNRVRFSIILNPRVDIERRQNSEYYRKEGISLQYGPFCI